MARPTIAVVGASGRLGSLIVEALVAAETKVVSIARAPAAARHHSPEQLRAAFGRCDVVINASPQSGSELHRVALESRCHVLDVTVGDSCIDEVLRLDGLARDTGRAVLPMAGLAPGLTGCLGVCLLGEHPDAHRIDIVLVQSASGSSGSQGTREMLDWLTDPAFKLRGHFVSLVDGARPATRTMFTLPGPEPARLPGGERLRLATAFDSPAIHLQLRLLRGVRRMSPGAYRRLRDRLARAKALAPPADDERIRLSAVAVGAEGEPLGWRSLSLTSDYGATAAVVGAAAQLAAAGAIPAGARGLAVAVELDTLVAQPLVARILLSRSAGRTPA